MSSLRQGVLFAGILIFLQHSTGNSQDTCQPKTDVGHIKKRLLCGYDKTVRPVSTISQTINTSVHLYPRSVDLDEERHVLKVYSWMWTNWKDEFLQWPLQTGIPFHSDNIWTPDLTVFSSYDGGKRPLSSTLCWLQPGAQMHCTPAVLFEAHCAPDLRRWPMDEQSCSFRIGSTHSTRGIRLLKHGNGVIVNVQPSGKWELLNVTAIEGARTNRLNETYEYITYTFTIRRHSGAHLATIVVPAFILSLMTLLTFFLEAGCPERITLGSMNALAHCLYLQYLGMQLPPNGDSVPAIVAFFRDSMLLAGASLALAVFVRGLAGARAPPPAWLSSLIGAVLSTSPGRLLLSQLSSTSVAAAPKSVESSDALDGGSDGGSGGDVGGCGEGGGGGGGAKSPPESFVCQHTALLLDRVALIAFVITFSLLIANYVL